MTRALSFVFVAVSVAVWTAAGCAPLGLKGQACTDGPCATGLICTDGVCEEPEPIVPPPPPCADDTDCVVNGTSDGRVCTDGVCGYASCTIDFECGARICDQGTCADTVPCFEDVDCPDAQICASGTCRSPCFIDEQCAVAGLPLASCQQGECVQRCLGDFMCIGGICEDNLCSDPDCVVDEDCSGPGSYFCDAGRCTQFTPCEEDDDCFDPNFQCNELGRCEERASCRVDADCGAGLCIDQHCRDAETCTANADCTDGECIAGRCTNPPLCRVDGDCSAPAVCDGARCVPEPNSEDAAHLVADFGLGPCVGGPGVSSGACTAVVLDAGALAVGVQGYGGQGAPLRATLGVTVDVDTPANVAATVVPGGVEIALSGPASGSVAIASGAVSIVIALVAVTPPLKDGCVVIVVDADGAPVAGASVRCGDAGSTTTDGRGVAAVPFAASAEDGVVVSTADGRGVAVLAPPTGAWRVVLPSLDAPSSDVAGLRVGVTSNGDEPGPVGQSFALPAPARAADATLAALFGAPFVASVEVPILGATSVVLPAAAIIEGTLPLGQPQTVKGEALAVAPIGPSFVFAAEGRYETDALIQLALGADPVELALDLAALAEGSDVALAHGGLLEALPLVVDGDLLDGVEDVDGDGDVTELVPDYLAFPELATTPAQGPAVRTTLYSDFAPDGARARLFAACGVELPGVFAPIGVAALFGGADDPERPGEQLKALAPGAEVAGRDRACAVHAVFDEPGVFSFAQRSSNGLLQAYDFGALLAPPAGAFLLDDIPVAGRSSVVFPADITGDLVEVQIFDGSVSWAVVAAGGGSVALPVEIAPVAVIGATQVETGWPSPFFGYRASFPPRGRITDGVRAAAGAP